MPPGDATEFLSFITPDISRTPSMIQNAMMGQPLVKTVEETIRTFNMLQPKDEVLIGVSGGPDSMALLHVLVMLAPTLNLKLGVAHLDHDLRKGVSSKEALFVSSICKEIGLPFFARKKNIYALKEKYGESLEAAGRRARYEFFATVAHKHGFNKIAIGHHADDNAELVLMNLLRGSGPLGLSGIPPSRGNIFVRPLIRLKRSEILCFLEKNHIPFVLDESNKDLHFLRNRIRLHLIPELIRTYNPNLIETLNRTASILRTEEDWTRKHTHTLLEKTADIGSDIVRIPVKEMLKNHPALQRRIVRAIVEHVKGNLKRIAYSHIESILNLCRSGADERSVHLPGKLIAYRKKNVLFISRQSSDVKIRTVHQEAVSIPLYIYKIPRPGPDSQHLIIKETGARLMVQTNHIKNLGNISSAGQKIAFFDMDKLSFPLTLRNFQPGDRFTPLGMSGTQKVNKFFINNKIPREKRREIPILLSKKKIVWVVGYRINETVKVTQQTEKVLKMELSLA